jgi:hypothetical protein
VRQSLRETDRLAPLPPDCSGLLFLAVISRGFRVPLGFLVVVVILGVGALPKGCQHGYDFFDLRHRGRALWSTRNQIGDGHT